MKSDRRHVKEYRRLVFVPNFCQVVQGGSEVRENLIIGCLSCKSTHFHCLKGQVITSLRGSFPSQSFRSPSFLKTFRVPAIYAERMHTIYRHRALLNAHLDIWKMRHENKIIAFLHVLLPRGGKIHCIESFQGCTALEDACPCLCSHKHDLIFKSSPEKDNGEREA